MKIEQYISHENKQWPITKRKLGSGPKIMFNFTFPFVPIFFCGNVYLWGHSELFVFQKCLPALVWLKSEAGGIYTLMGKNVGEYGQGY